MVTPAVRRLVGVMLGVLAVAVAAGTATTGAGPHAGGKGAKRIPVPLADMARTHAEIVLVLGALTLVLLYLLDRSRAPGRVTDRARFLLAVMVAQGIVGYTQYFTHLPALLVGVHVFGATVVWTTMIWFADGLSHHELEAVASPVCVGCTGTGVPREAVPAAVATPGPAVASPVGLPTRRNPVGSDR